MVAGNGCMYIIGIKSSLEIETKKEITGARGDKAAE